MNQLPEDKIKTLLTQAKVSADARLKERILHQIDAENALIVRQTSKKAKSNGALFPFWILYALFPMFGAIYFINCEPSNFIQTPAFSIIMLFSITCCAFWAITYFDAKRKVGRKT